MAAIFLRWVFLEGGCLQFFKGGFFCKVGVCNFFKVGFCERCFSFKKITRF